MTKYSIFPEGKYLSQEEHEALAKSLDNIVWAYYSSVGPLVLRDPKKINADLSKARKLLKEINC